MIHTFFESAADRCMDLGYVSTVLSPAVSTSVLASTSSLSGLVVPSARTSGVGDVKNSLSCWPRTKNATVLRQSCPSYDVK